MVLNALMAAFFREGWSEIIRDNRIQIGDMVRYENHDHDTPVIWLGVSKEGVDIFWDQGPQTIDPIRFRGVNHRLSDCI